MVQNLSIELITILMFGSMFLFLALGLPIAFVLGGTGIIFGILLWGPSSTFLISAHAIGFMRTIILIAVPLFIFMACVLERAGIAEDLYTAMHYWMGGLRGGLAAGTVLICTVFAAMSGVSAAGTVTMGIIALPNMLKRKYDKKISIGCIMAGGALGPLIPPSVLLIIWGLFAEISVGKLFAGGLLPGLLLSALFITYILIRCHFNPNLGPSLPPEERATWREKLVSLRAVILPALLVISVLGSIFLGMTTPTESAAVGALGALICAAIYRRLNWQMFKEAAFRTLKITCMVMWVMLAAMLFVSVYQGMGAPQMIENLLTTIPVSKWTILIMMQITWLGLGCFVDSTSIIFITGPVFIPVAVHLGFDPIWFGIVYAVNVEAGYLTPPFGMNLFYMKGIVPKCITMLDIYRSVLPFVMLQVIGLVCVILFPPLATWLPGMLFK